MSVKVKLIIEIDPNIIYAIQNNTGVTLGNQIDICNAIKNGKPLSENKGRTYGEIINFYLNGLVETYKRMGYIITEISITRKDNSLNPIIYEFGGTESEEI